MARVEYIRTFSGQTVAIFEHESNGDITAREYPSKKILGYYKKSSDTTTNFQGQILYRGNAIAALIVK